MGNCVHISLTCAELLLAGQAGVMRRVESIKSKRKNPDRVTKTPWENDIVGCIGEAAVSKFLGVYFGGNLCTFKRPDLPGKIQVRATTNEDGHLIYRPGESLEDLYVLVIVDRAESTQCMIWGWMQGKQAKEVGEFTDFGHPDKPKAYQVLRSKLHPIESLKRE